VNQTQGIAHRVIMAGLGGVSGLALWQLGEQWDNPAMAPAHFLALLVFVAVFSSVALALSGPVTVARSLSGAAMMALVLTLLVSLAGTRHVVATDLLDDRVMLTVAAVLVLFATPFLLVWMRVPNEVMHYGALFEAAWRMTVRYGLALVFVAIFWLVVALSDALLDLVEIDAMERLMRQGWARFGLSGAVLGLGLAVVHELRETISPYLLLRLLRLLLPLVLAVVAVFLVAVPLNGLNRLFGEFSVAGTLIGTAAVAVTLISTALDRDDSDAVRTRGLQLATQALAVLLPPLTLLAVWAVALRVRQYGWTPDRIMAMAVAGFLMSYGLAYCGAVLLRGGWMARIRRVNVAMALMVIAGTVLWMTPVLDVYRISTASQIDRFRSDRITLSQLALWPMAHEWGKAGQAGLSTLEAMSGEPGRAGLDEQIAAARVAENRYQFEQRVQNRLTPGRVEGLARLMPVRPEGAGFEATLLDGIPAFALEMWLDGCQRRTADDRPGCVMVLGAFLPSVPAEEQAMVLYLDAGDRTRISHVIFGTDNAFQMRDVLEPATGAWPVLPAAAISEIQDGAFELKPSGVNALSLGGRLLAPAQ
jgi:hypothetical protein